VGASSTCTSQRVQVTPLTVTLDRLFEGSGLRGRAHTPRWRRRNVFGLRCCFAYFVQPPCAPGPYTVYTHAPPPAPNLHQTNLLRGIATREPMRLATQSVIVPMRMHGGPREKILPGIGVGWHSMQRTLHRFISGGWGRLHARALALPVLSSASCGPTVTCHVRGLEGGGTRTLCCPRAAEPPADL
jgi:hypothetical protein